MTLTELESSERPLLTVREVADVLSMPLSTLYDIIKREQLPARVIRMGGRVYISRASLIEMLGPR